MKENVVEDGVNLPPCRTWAKAGEVGGGPALEERRHAMRREHRIFSIWLKNHSRTEKARGCMPGKVVLSFDLFLLTVLNLTFTDGDAHLAQLATVFPRSFISPTFFIIGGSGTSWLFLPLLTTLWDPTQTLTVAKA